jgi:hypothetical protein
VSAGLSAMTHDERCEGGPKCYCAERALAQAQEEIARLKVELKQCQEDLEWWAG